MYRVLAAAALVLLAAHPGDAAADVAACAKITDPAKRLACYDELSRPKQPATEGWDGDSLNLAPGATRTPGLAPEGYQLTGVGDWTIRNETLADGSRAIILATLAKGTGGTLQGTGAWPVLSIRCADEETFVYVNWNTIVDIGGSSTVKVELKIDSNETERTHWSRYSDHRTTGLWTNRASVDFAKQLFGKSSLITELKGVRATYTAQFNVSGLEPAVAPLRRACDW